MKKKKKGGQDMLRVGLGTDIHRLVKSRPLILGGVRVPYEKGLKGHSDADALIHAVIDAILGAMGGPDIGDLFPDDREEFKGADSGVLLKRVMRILKRRGFGIVNIDTVITAQRPRLGAYKGKIAARLAELLGLSRPRVAVKAKSAEGLDAVGQKKAISAQAVVLLVKENS